MLSTKLVMGILSPDLEAFVLGLAGDRTGSQSSFGSSSDSDTAADVELLEPPAGQSVFATSSRLVL